MRYVYLANIEGTDIYKIGFSKEPKKRIKSLQTGNSKKINLIHSFKTEKATKVESVLHRKFNFCKKDSIDGNKLIGEWFELAEGQAESFIASCKLIDTGLKVADGDIETEMLYQERVGGKKRKF